MKFKCINPCFNFGKRYQVGDTETEFDCSESVNFEMVDDAPTEPAGPGDNATALADLEAKLKAAGEAYDEKAKQCEALVAGLEQAKGLIATQAAEIEALKQDLEQAKAAKRTKKPAE